MGLPRSHERGSVEAVGIAKTSTKIVFAFHAPTSVAPLKRP